MLVTEIDMVLALRIFKDTLLLDILRRLKNERRYDIRLGQRLLKYKKSS